MHPRHPVRQRIADQQRDQRVIAPIRMVATSASK
jgi:hypothetical protein